MTRDEKIAAIVDAELDGMELDALMEFYREERTANLEKIDAATLENVAKDLEIS
jgi:hypothetical protein